MSISIAVATIDLQGQNRYNIASNLGEIMQKCEITGKGKQFGNNVSFSQRHTKKVWKPNLQTRTMIVDGKKVKLKVSTQALRTLKKQAAASK